MREIASPKGDTQRVGFAPVPVPFRIRNDCQKHKKFSYNCQRPGG